MKGKGVSGGIAIGRLAFRSRPDDAVRPAKAEDTGAELARFETARAEAIAQLGELAVRTAGALGAENAALFEIHQMMLEDSDYCESVATAIGGEGLCAEYAVWRTGRQFSEQFARMEDAYMRERAADIRDVSGRVVGILTGRQCNAMRFDEPVILAADDLAPSETAQLQRDKVLAIAARGGAANSHTAIFARTMGIPSVIGLGEELSPALDGRQAALDGDEGILYLDPDEQTLEALREKQRRQQSYTEELERFRGKPTATGGGRSVKLYANIGSPADVQAALAGDAEGIGLFRSEFLYLESDDYPDEQTQFEAYRSVLEAMGGRRVIIRTLDIGADKQAAYFGLPQEENPAMGMRAIRICLTRPEIFRVQLRAIYRASAYGSAAIMFPMITAVQEVRRAKEIVSQVRNELAEEGIAFDETLPVGIMIETPASALISDLLAKEVDFFSVGTNDLSQYTMAVDRQNEALGEFFDPHHEAVLRMIRTAAENAHQNGIWIGICGELAADKSLTGSFLDMGIDELSVAPGAILELRRHIAWMQ